MAARPLPPPEILRQLLRYEPETGRLFWRQRGPEWFTLVRLQKVWNNRFANKEAFLSETEDGYRYATFLSVKRVLAHRVIWAMHFGDPGQNEIDHENRDKTDNRLTNLRLSSRSQNMMNTGINRRNTSGYKGVSFHKGKGKWCASIKVDGVQKSLGTYASADLAHAAYQTAAKSLFREFASTE